MKTHVALQRACTLYAKRSDGVHKILLFTHRYTQPWCQRNDVKSRQVHRKFRKDHDENGTLTSLPCPTPNRGREPSHFVIGAIESGTPRPAQPQTQDVSINGPVLRVFQGRVATRPSSAK